MFLMSYLEWGKVRKGPRMIKVVSNSIGTSRLCFSRSRTDIGNYIRLILQHAMSVMGISQDDQYNVMYIVAGILHMGNITFKEHNNYAAIVDDECEFNLTFCSSMIL